MLKAAGSAAGARLGELERREAALVRRSREIDEALAAGARAEQLTLEVLDSLSSASTWGLVDMVSDSFFSDMIKYSHIDEAQSRIEALQAQLRRFGTELRDVDGRGMGLNIQIDGFLTFADYFFDNFFVDMAVNSRIDRPRRRRRPCSRASAARLPTWRPCAMTRPPRPGAWTGNMSSW